MKRLALTTCVAALALVGAGSAASAVAAATLCVGGSGCFSTIQAAVDAAHDGDTIRIAPGTFAGGVAIDVSVDIRGAGAGATIISGGTLWPKRLSSGRAPRIQERADAGVP